ncbi:hypothetical protein GW17_00000534 [Ensete ventricosum]|nr:hypothetical protein GW17_00000534 [Ensete ventricosum]
MHCTYRWVLDTGYRISYHTEINLVCRYEPIQRTLVLFMHNYCFVVFCVISIYSTHIVKKLVFAVALPPLTMIRFASHRDATCLHEEHANDLIVACPTSLCICVDADGGDRHSVYNKDGGCTVDPLGGSQPQPEAGAVGNPIASLAIALVSTPPLVERPFRRSASALASTQMQTSSGLVVARQLR